jgi:hypothetical protein
VTVDKNASTFSVTAPATFDADTKEGEATILISDGVEHTIVRTVLLSLASGVTTINLSQAQFLLDVIGTEEEQADLSTSMILIPAKATAADLDFESSDPAIAEIDADGVITAKSEGQVTITVKSKANASVSKTVTVDVLLTSPGFTIVDGVVTAYSGPGGDLKVPSKATAIGDGVNSQNSGKFQNNTTITSIDLNNVVRLGVNAFKSATAIVFVNAPNLEYIGEECFHGATSLETLISPKLKSLSGYSFQNCVKLKTIDVSKVVELTGSGNGQRAFKLCKSLESIDMPLFEGDISFQMFQGCEKLASVNIPNAISVGGSNYTAGSNVGQVFADILPTVLTELNFPEVTVLPWRSINGSISSLKVPKVTHLGPQALGYLSNVHYLYLPKVEYIATNQFNGRDPGPIVLDLSEATGLATVANDAFPDQDGIEIYVATDEIKALFTTTNPYTKTTITVGPPPSSSN